MDPKFVACRECDLLHRRVALPPDGVAHCQRCAAVLYAHRRDRSDQTIAWALTGAILFVIANSFPIVSVAIQGNVIHATLLSSVHELYLQSRPLVAGVVLFTAVVAPAVRIAGVLYVLLALKFGRRPPHLSQILRVMDVTLPWNMVSIFLLGVLVSLTKLGAIAEVILGPGLWALTGLIVTLAATDATFDPEPVWSRIPPVTA